MTTIAIVVLYNDSPKIVEGNIRRIAAQVEQVILIDNSAVAYVESFSLLDKVTYLPQMHNIGIAAAQNIGIQIAMKEKFDFIFFADPDSFIPSDTVKQLQDRFLQIQKKDINIGGVGASAFNLQTNKMISFDNELIKDCPEWETRQLTYLMNSASLIAVPLFEKVGLMWEELFIDGVDCEWCWRASYKAQAHFYQDQTIVIQHRLGNEGKKVGGKVRSIGTSARLFYQYRNYLWLLRKRYVPRKWLIYNGWKYLIKSVYYPLCVPPHGANLKNIIKGIYHGIKINRK